MYNFGDCGETKKDIKIVCEENTRKFVGLNLSRKEIFKVKVDGCLTINGKKCDWLLIDTGSHIAHFIELKGCELNTAVKQLGNSILVVSKPQNGYIEKEFSKKNAYAVLSRCPIDGPGIQKLKIKFKKEYKADLTVRNKIFELKF